MQSLPLPGPDERDLSLRLQQLICSEIETRGGAIPFDRYMELALYAPGLGYYMAGQRKFGAEGDFVTAPELSPLFSRALARQVKQLLGECAEADVLEFGAGSGRLAVDLLRELQALDALPQRYLILELSPELRQRQQQLVAAEIPHLQQRVQWLQRLPLALRGTVIANEVLDAMPVQRLRAGVSGAIEEEFVVCDQGVLASAWRPASAKLQQQFEKLGVKLPAGVESELNLRLSAWIVALSGLLEKGALLLIDYGYSRSDYYHLQHGSGTLLCHYRQLAHGDPFYYPGIQDITAHVDFTAVAEAADEADLRVAGYTTQASFLLDCGIERLLQGGGAAQDAVWFQQTSELKRLLLPTQMGERFKVMALTRGIEEPLLGFTTNNRLEQL
jgi:SAM-dependent MidA family methyltransferase